MEIQFLGTGAGMPSKQRNTSAIVMKLLQERGTFWLFDCGEATQHQMLYTALKPRKLEKIFITHLHGDHIFGLPGLLGSRSFLAGDSELTIYGPKGIKEWIHTTIRLSKTALQYPLTVVEISEGVIFEDDTFCVEAKELAHVIPSFGYRVTQKPLPPTLILEEAITRGVPRGPLLGQLKAGHDVELEDGSTVKSRDVTTAPADGFVVSILGDTKFCEASIQLCDEADLVIHEATFDGDTEKLAAEYGHSTIHDAAKVAQLANAKQLIATHISARFIGSAVRTLLEQGKTIFPFLTIAEDFSTYEWKNRTFHRIDSALMERKDDA
ncbi:ribonuclease Z [Paenisporosarcina cavernae]|uniref:Ribonuclease Z n=1 Tax=Paenisporosarcina cavernae TaxID=2320858 RepID=A0A385YVC2_9BACL|nr:ribonuclease Z [Paenisporosarcina cavernae]AYC29512.1 ribonuclease Z [Paenisporosarcina cavernae]